MAPWTALRNYTAHPDPVVAAGNTIAMVVACNQPFYPLYLYFWVSHDIGVSFLTFLSTPFFSRCRRWPGAIRWRDASCCR